MITNNPQADAAKQNIIDDLLKDLPENTATEVYLPSECRVYTLEDPDMPITIRPMTFEDEKSIVSAKKEHDPVNLVLQRCVTNVKVPDLLPMDKLYLIMKLREISYGDEYNTLLLCQECTAENPMTVKLSELNVNPVPDDFSDPIEITLPQLGKKAHVRLPRVKDERLFLDTDAALNQLWRFVADIDGHSDKSIISAVMDKLPLIDVRTILNTIKSDYGVDTKIKFECKECGGVSVVDLPIDANFFDVS
tara:strand:- start:1212 stop:1958 length:747 start_codon:yes stop_codon:yes gene_type:complete